MKNLIELIKTTALGGLVLLLPLAVLVLTVTFMLKALIRMNAWLAAKLPFIQSHPTLKFIVVAIILLLMCLAAGVLVRTQWGTNWARKLDTFVDSKVPMYGLLRNMAKRFTGENMLELSPAEISLHGGDTKVIGFVMERLGDGRATVYVPTSPLVSHGQVYIVPATSIAKLEASPRTVIDVLTSWGYGSRALCASDPEETAAPDKDGAG